MIGGRGGVEKTIAATPPTPSTSEYLMTVIEFTYTHTHTHIGLFFLSFILSFFLSSSVSIFRFFSSPPISNNKSFRSCCFLFCRWWCWCCCLFPFLLFRAEVVELCQPQKPFSVLNHSALDYSMTAPIIDCCTATRLLSDFDCRWWFEWFSVALSGSSIIYWLNDWLSHLLINWFS